MTLTPSTIRAAAGIVGGLFLLAFAIWVWRIDTLRASHLERLNQITAAVGRASGNPNLRTADVVARVQAIAQDRDDARQDLGQCRANRTTLEGTIANQNRAIAELRAAGERRMAELNRVTDQANRDAGRAAAEAREILARRPGPDVCRSADELILETVR